MGAIEGISLSLVWAVVTSVMGCLLPAGHALGVINSPEKVMRSWVVSGCSARDWSLSEGVEVTLWAAVVSSFVAGAAIGSTIAPKIADKIGRKGTLLATQILAALSCGLFLTCYAAQYVELLLLGRLVAGLSAGMATVIVSLYLSEVCPSSLKGVFSAIVPLGFTIGMLIAYISGLPQLLGGANSWPFLLSMPVVYVLLGFMVLPFAPESPAYCCTMLHDEQRAQAELMRLRCQAAEGVEAELHLLRASAKHMDKDGSWSLINIWQDPQLRKLLLWVFLLNCGQQLSGINAVFYYSTLVFRSAGLDDLQSTIATLFIFIANTVMSVAALPLLRYCRRRVLLTVSMLGMLACQVTLVVALTIVVKQTSTVIPSNMILSTTVLPPSSKYHTSNSTHKVIVDIDTNDLILELFEDPLSTSASLVAGEHRLEPQSPNSAVQPGTLPPHQRPVDGSAEGATSAVAAGVVAMVAMILFVVLYGGGVGPIPYSYAAESFPCGPRGLAVAVGGAANWGGNFAVGLLFPLLQRQLDQFSFLVFTGITTLLLLGTLWKLPEPPQCPSSAELYDTSADPGLGSETAGPLKTVDQGQL